MFYKLRIRKKNTTRKKKRTLKMKLVATTAAVVKAIDRTDDRPWISAIYTVFSTPPKRSLTRLMPSKLISSSFSPEAKRSEMRTANGTGDTTNRRHTGIRIWHRYEVHDRRTEPYFHLDEIFRMRSRCSWSELCTLYTISCKAKPKEFHLLALRRLSSIRMRRRTTYAKPTSIF